MKRLVWLFLAVFCTALAQVQPVTFAAPRDHTSCCCKGEGSCGMPDCLPPPVSARSVPMATEPARIAVPAAKRLAEPSSPTAEKFYAAFVAPVAVTAAAHSPDRVTPPASVPLFAAHCSFLI